MDATALIEQWKEPRVLAAGGLFIGLLFGYFSQRSRFCLRAAVVEFWHGQFNDRLSVWLLAFSTSILTVQILLMGHWLDVSQTRLIGTRGSLAGALMGGLMFGCGMIMTRGCASRLLILSANGNLRALLSGLVFAVTAQSALSGALAPWRLAISEWWTVEGGASRDLLQVSGLGPWGGIVIAGTWFCLAIVFSRMSEARSNRMWWGGMGAGLAVALAWWFNGWVARNSFEVVPVQAITFSGPSAEWLMRVLSVPDQPIGFNFGLLPGVFVGSFLAAWLGKQLRIEGFKDGYSMTRYIAGAVLMGFGAMLAGGCAVGAGISGGSIFSLTAWMALVGMWIGGGLTDRLLDNRTIGLAIKRPGSEPVVVAP